MKDWNKHMECETHIDHERLSVCLSHDRSVACTKATSA